MLSENGLSMKRGTVVDAMPIAPLSSAKNEDKKHDPKMTQTRKGNRWHFGMKVHIGVDPESVLVHAVECATAKVADITMMESCLHGEESLVLGDRGYHKKNRTIDTFKKEGDLTALTPTKKPAGGTLSKEQRAFNRLLSAIWVVVAPRSRTRSGNSAMRRVRYTGKNSGNFMLTSQNPPVFDRFYDSPR